ncbi:MAG TPA: protein kinase [Thermoanaerobaculia bacterium]|nr:protein kinase [Thermoanaerobaculia bacterium]
MPLQPGDRVGAYEILSTLGAGGMGVVYRARDAKLGRDVAIKMLPEDVAADSERLAPFEREARMLAALNHPNIATVYGFEQADATHFLTMEVVEGATRRPHRARPHCSRAGAVALRADRRGSRGGARQGHHPPRPQTGQHQDRGGRWHGCEARSGQDPRLRAGESAHAGGRGAIGRRVAPARGH